MNDQEWFWKGEFGDNYTDRVRVNWIDRIPFWTEIIAKTGARSVLEIGCNAGWNLLAIRSVLSWISLYGVEINQKSLQQARNLGFMVSEKLSKDTIAHLVFTAGVLIHVSPSNLEKTMKDIIGASHNYVLAVEYDSQEEQEIDYRGHREKLWKRPYGKLYQGLGLELLDSGEAKGFDQCRYWLLQR